MTEKTLPTEDSDFSLPGRMEESDLACFERASEPAGEPRPKNISLAIFGIVFILVAAGAFSYYFLNQSEIDSRILDSSAFETLEDRMVSHYKVGLPGSDHAHAAIAVFVEGDALDFSVPQFQLQSKYIHFENGNAYQIHKHASRVPLDMLFASFGLKVTSGCIEMRPDVGAGKRYCADAERSVTVLVNGKAQNNISLYEIRHDDRILISFGDSKLISEQLEYLESFEIHNVPDRLGSRDIMV